VDREKRRGAGRAERSKTWEPVKDWKREATSSRAGGGGRWRPEQRRAELVSMGGGEGKGTVLLVCGKWGGEGEP
jgi:hypothetical protein